MENWNFKNGILNKFGILEFWENLIVDSIFKKMEFWKIWLKILFFFFKWNSRKLKFEVGILEILEMEF